VENPSVGDALMNADSGWAGKAKKKIGTYCAYLRAP